MAEGQAIPEPAPRNYSDILTVLVGPQEAHFTVHKATVCAESPFFRAACSHEWIEGKKKIVRLPEQDSEVFEAFVHWIYSKELDLSLVREDAGVRHAPSFLNLGRMWALAHYLGCLRLQNQVIDAIILKQARDGASIATITLNNIWDISPPESTIRRLLKEITVQVHRTTSVEKVKNMPQDIVFEAAYRLLSGVGNPVSYPSIERRCDYHEHDEGEAKCD